MRILGLGLLILVGLAAEATAGTVVLDQFFDPTTHNGVTLIGGAANTRNTSQTLRAGVTGLLDSVDLRLVRHHTPNADLRIHIHRVPEGAPPYLSYAVGSVVIPWADVPTFDQWLHVDLTPLALQITAGERLAISAAREPGGDGTYGWYYLQNELSANTHLNYLEGNEWTKYYLGQPSDHHFRTYVQVAQTAPLPSAAWAGLGLLGLLGLARRYRR